MYQSPRAEHRTSTADWRNECIRAANLRAMQPHGYHPKPTFQVQREPLAWIVYGLAMMAFGGLAGAALTLFLTGAPS